jgi:hypothetical protein
MLVAVGALVALGNCLILFRYLSSGVTSSLIPVIGGVTAAVGVALLPGGWRWAWVPLLLDPGCAWMVGGTLVLLPWHYYRDFVKDEDDPSE